MTPAAHPAVATPSTSEPSLQLSALLHTAAISSLDHVGWIHVTGEDRVRWLNGMATNAIQQLAPGTGSYSFFLNAQGRIQGDALIFAEPKTILIETHSSQTETLIPYLDHYIIMDDVELKNVTGDRSGLALAGPQSTSMLAQIGLTLADTKPLTIHETTWNSTPVTLIHTYSPLVPRYELWSDLDTIAAITQALHTAGAAIAHTQALEWLRILEGTPLYHTDIRDRDLPQETNQTRALHFAKGCYLGQEIVERIRSRGNVHRTFHAFRLEGSFPPANTPLEAAGKQIGELTTVASIPLSPQNTVQLALGYVRREALDRSAPLTYPGGTAIPIATPYAEAT